MPRIRETLASMQAFARRFEEIFAAEKAKTTASMDAPRTSRIDKTANARLHEMPNAGLNPGALRSHVHVPHCLADKPALVVALHGCGQTAAEFDHGTGWSTLADRHGFIVLYPEQQTANNPNACFTWFLPADTTRGKGEAQSINEMVEQTIERFGVDRQRVYVTGLSAGGAMTSVMLATYPEVFAAGAIVAGLPYGAARTVQEAFQAMFTDQRHSPRALGDRVRQASTGSTRWPRISVWHGTADAVVKPSNAEHIVDQWVDVHGLAGEPTHESRIAHHTRRVWNDATGNTLIEAFSIDGMAHGVPLAPAQDAQACGHAGPFFIDVGLCSTRHIAASWGLSAAPVETTASSQVIERVQRLVPLDATPAPTGSEANEAAQPAARTLDPAAVIEAAFKSAGLQSGAAKQGVFAQILPTIEAAMKAAGLRRS